MSTEAQAAWQAARRILAVRLDNLGDVLMTTPAMAALASDRELTLLTSASGAALRPHLPWIADWMVHDAPWAKGGGAPRSPDADRALIEELSRRRFDAAVIFTVCTQSALPAAMLCRLAGIPLRLAHCRENPYELLSDWRADHDVCADGMRHEVSRQLDLVASVGFVPPSRRLRFEVLADDRASLQHRLERAGAEAGRPWVVVHPGATAASRRWPARRFGEAAAAIAGSTACQVLVAGAASEREMVDEVIDAARACGEDRVIAMPPDLRLGEFAALIEAAAAVLCNNSGPAHLAAALGTPVAVLYAMTNPQHTPWQVPSRVLQRVVACRNCLKSVCPQGHHACLADVPASEAAQAVESLLRDATRGSARCAAPADCEVAAA